MTIASNANAGSWCGRAVHGVSSLSSEDMRQVEALRARERPVPWRCIAERFSVNEADLRRLCAGWTGESPLEPVVLELKPTAPSHTPARDARFTAMWMAGDSTDQIGRSLGMAKSTIWKARVRLDLPPRHPDRNWTPELDARLRKLWSVPGASAGVIAKILGTGRKAVGRRAQHLGLVRAADLKAAA